MKTKSKPTECIFITFRDTDNRAVDIWTISRNEDNSYSIEMWYPQNHHAWLGPYDTNRRQYDINCLALNADETAFLLPQLKKFREKRRVTVKNAEGAAEAEFTPDEVKMMRLSDKGLGYKKIADLVPCSHDTVKQFFSRGARKRGFASSLAMIKYAAAQNLFLQLYTLVTPGLLFPACIFAA